MLPIAYGQKLTKQQQLQKNLNNPKPLTQNPPKPNRSAVPAVCTFLVELECMALLREGVCLDETVAILLLLYLFPNLVFLLFLNF